jgi:hypothetical protein
MDLSNHDYMWLAGEWPKDKEEKHQNLDVKTQIYMCSIPKEFVSMYSFSNSKSQVLSHYFIFE